MPFFHKSASNSRLQQKVPNSEFSVGLPEPLVQRRLTRQRKLRHLTDRDVGFEHPRSSPDCPDFSAKPRSPLGGSERWSSSALPLPLPLPEFFPVQSPESGSWNSGQGRVGSPIETPVRWVFSYFDLTFALRIDEFCVGFPSIFVIFWFYFVKEKMSFFGLICFF